jgi:hypothetical protein
MDCFVAALLAMTALFACCVIANCEGVSPKQEAIHLFIFLSSLSIIFSGLTPLSSASVGYAEPCGFRLLRHFIPRNDV